MCLCFITFQIQNEIKYNTFFKFKMSLNITSFKRNLTLLYNLLTHKIKVNFGSRKVLSKGKNNEK